MKGQPKYSVLFGYFDSSTGINLLVAKLPLHLQDKWATEATKYKKREAVVYPPFSFFVSVLKDIAKLKNDPSFSYGNVDKTLVSKTGPIRHNTPTITVRKTEALQAPSASETNSIPRCPLHHTRHLLNDCNGFCSKTIEDRRSFIFTNGICLKCCGPKKHHAKNCKADVRCGPCGNTSHPTALHQDLQWHEGERPRENVSASCTQICGTTHSTSKSCAKIIPVTVYPGGSRQQSRVTYALIDDQSNHSLVSPSFLEAFSIEGPEHAYTLISCAGAISSSGRRGLGFIVESLDGNCSFELLTLIECSELPNNREEIPSPRVAEQFPHLPDIVGSIHEPIPHAEIELLIGRDLIIAHYVLDQRTGENGAPYAQKLPLGWAIIGPVCLDALHVPTTVTVNKTYVMSDGRPSLFQPCDSEDSIFLKTDQDEKLSLSIEDRTFLKIMEESFQKDSEGHWVAALPFRPNRPPLPNNKEQAISQSSSYIRP